MLELLNILFVKGLLATKSNDLSPINLLMWRLIKVLSCIMHVFKHFLIYWTFTFLEFCYMLHMLFLNHRTTTIQGLYCFRCSVVSREFKFFIRTILARFNHNFFVFSIILSFYATFALLLDQLLTIRMWCKSTTTQPLLLFILDDWRGWLIQAELTAFLDVNLRTSRCGRNCLLRPVVGLHLEHFLTLAEDQRDNR